jgi:hypothetical protein
MFEIIGFKITGTNLKRANNILDKARKRVREAVTEEYNRLLAYEVTELVDDIAMGMAPRPDIPIIDAACDTLNERIRYAGMGMDIEYNLEVSGSLMTDGTDTYLLLHTKNQYLIEAFAGSSSEIINCSVKSQSSAILGEEAEETDIVRKWKELMNKYGDNLTLTAMNVVLSGPVRVDDSRLVFPSPAERAGTRARHSLENKLLSMYACGREIPPHKLMEYIDRALIASTTEENGAAIDEMAVRLTAVLPNITVELIRRDPKNPVEENFPETIAE